MGRGDLVGTVLRAVRENRGERTPRRCVPTEDGEGKKADAPEVRPYRGDTEDQRCVCAEGQC